MMISQKKAFEAAETISEYCKQQRGCQNCIFRDDEEDHCGCHIRAFELTDVISNIEAKKKHGGYID